MPLGHAAKRNRWTGFLALLFAGLIAAIGFLHWRDQPLDAPQRLAENVHTITIERRDAETIVLQREKSWHITSPIQIAVNEQRIIPLMTVYTNPDPGYNIASVDLEATGLNDPEVGIRFNDYEVKIGAVAIEGGRRHALHGDRVRFVPDWVLPLLQGGVSAMADLTVWGNRLSALTFANGESLGTTELQAAQELSAQQFVPWPRTDMPPTTATYEVTATHDGSSNNWTLTVNDRYIAVHNSASDYAYIVSPDDVPWLP